ncbi:MAG: hypothetical protein HYS73_00910 [Parcubacteria group bacterium]|nr:hypothetical protein [Parcubacteria group bacterium]
MLNIWLFLVTATVYAWIGYISFLKVDSLQNFFLQRTGRHAKVLGIAILLALPVNVGGYVWTIAGNASGEKGVYSLFSMYQHAEKGNTFSVLSFLGYQHAGNEAVTGFGVSGYQHAGENALTFIGVSGYQRAGNDAVTAIGVSGYQRAGKNAVTAIGVSGYQRAGKNAVTAIGVGIYQKVPGKERTFGAFTTLKADVEKKEK